MQRSEWVWKSVDGRVVTLDTITDSHLQNLERVWSGRGTLTTDLWQRKKVVQAKEMYDLVRLELQTRGLELRTDTADRAKERFLARMANRGQVR